MYWFYVKLTKARDILEEGASAEKLSLSDWPIDTTGAPFSSLIDAGGSPLTVGGATPALVVPGSLS